jgi:hypothetical protein
MPPKKAARSLVQTGEIEWTAIKSHGTTATIRLVADEDENSFTGGDTFLTSVYAPTITAGT